MGFLTGLAKLEADFTGIRCFEFNDRSILRLADRSHTTPMTPKHACIFLVFRNWWIGLSDLNHEGRWVWQHSDQVNFLPLSWSINFHAVKTFEDCVCKLFVVYFPSVTSIVMLLRVHLSFASLYLFRMSVRLFGARGAPKTGQETAWTVLTLLSCKTTSWSGTT